MDQVKEVLRLARALIDKPERWTKGTDKRDARGKVLCGSEFGTAVSCRCAGSAIFECSSDPNQAKAARSLLCAAIERHTGKSHYWVCVWNDAPDRTHGEVMQAFDWALMDKAAAPPKEKTC